jgi:hypothetical protein
MLRRSAARMVEMAKTAVGENETDNTIRLAAVYRGLRSVSVRALLEGQAAAAMTMADSLPRRVPERRNDAGSSTFKKRSSGRVKRLE